MNDRIRCKLELQSYSPHLQQLYAGFLELGSKGKIELEVDQTHLSKSSNKPLLVVEFENGIRIAYDTLDSDRKFFDEAFNVNYYFKRSFKQDVINGMQTPGMFKPLGLNYYVLSRHSRYGFNDTVRGWKNFITHNKVLSRIVRSNQDSHCFIEDFECSPVTTDNPKILFSTRTWSPEESGVSLSHEEIEERKKINDERAEYIRMCRLEFGERFYGGFFNDEFTRRHYPDCILQDCRKTTYMRKVKESEICIATVGLHGSIGWKFAEYVAASRAIVTEPIYHKVPGDFQNGLNYLSFNESDSLKKALSLLLTDKIKRDSVMKLNSDYYHKHLRPDRLIWNSLETALNIRRP